MQRSLFLFLMLGFSSFLFANPTNPFQEVWDALENQDRVTTRKLLEQKLEEESTRTDAAMALILLNAIESREKENLELMKSVFPKMRNPSEYLFPIWLGKAVTNGYFRKEKKSEDFINQIIADERINGSIKGSAKYLLGMRYLMSNQKSKADKLWREIGALKNWKFVGPFENSMSSGFDKNYLPIERPESNTKFLSKNNANIYWFRPRSFQEEPYIASEHFFHDKVAIVYGQTFVDNPIAQKVILAAGAAGTLKIWLNDKLIIEEEEQLRTDMDLHTYELELPEGRNRILVQLGHTGKTSYPNFIIRFLDENLDPLERFNLNSSDEYQAYNPASSIKSIKRIPHFAELFFENKVKEQPKNILYHLLLSKTYYRSNKFNEAIKILEKALEHYPNNVLVHYELVQNYSSINDRTNLVKSIDDYRKLDEDSDFFAFYDFSEEVHNQNYAKVKVHLDQIKKHLGASDEEYYTKLIEYLGYKKEYSELIAVIEAAYRKYPNNSFFTEYKFFVEKNSNAKNNAPEKILEKYLENSYDKQIIDNLLQEYLGKGENQKVEKLILQGLKIFPESEWYIKQAIKFYYKGEAYEKALKYAEMALEYMPYNPGYWTDKAYIYQSLNRKEEAIHAMEQAIHFNPNLFKEREKLREWEGKKNLSTYFEKANTYDLIEAFLTKDSSLDEPYEYVFKETNIAVFKEGPSIEQSYIALKILNEAGLEEWKEATVSYDSDRQRLIISKAEVIKKNGQKIKAEQNKNHLVFPNLEVGDAILIKYQLENYTFGKLRKEFWTEQMMNGYVPIQSSVFRFFVPPDYEFEVKTKNLEIEPTKTKIDDFTIYEWNLENPEKVKTEDYMPTLMEVGQTIYISTVESWQTIAQWYSDLALTQAKEDFNLDKVYREIFEGKAAVTDYEKAKLIYEYLAGNVRYSSLPFRQNGYIPQKPMITISTQLGDCKDLSTLYHTLARKAGLKTNLVLVSSKDNGEENMLLPTNSFDHCIIKIDLEDGALFQELTDSKLPFGYVPELVRNAQGLIIPNDEKGVEGSDLILIPKWEKADNYLKRNTSIMVRDELLDVETEIKASGGSASSYRWYFSGSNQKDLKEKMQTLTNSYFENAISLKNFEMENSDNCEKNFQLKTQFDLEGELISIGSMKAVKPILFESVFEMAYFLEGERQYPFLFWRYNEVENYETEIVYELPEGEKWLELPENISFKESFIDYSLQVERLSDSKAKISRKIWLNLEKLPAKDYKKLREIGKAIIKAEGVYLVF